MQSFMLGESAHDINRLAMVRLLLAAGARCDVRDGDTRTPAETRRGGGCIGGGTSTARIVGGMQL